MAKAKKKKIKGMYKRGKHWWLDYSANGKRIRRSLDEQDKKKATDKALEILHPLKLKDEGKKLQAVKDALENNKDALKMAKAKQQSIKIADSWEAFVNHTSRSDCGDSTLYEYGHQWQRFVVFVTSKDLGLEYLNEIDESVAADFMKSIWNNGEISENRYNKYRNLCRLVFRVLADDTAIEDNPFRKIARRNSQSVSRTELTEQQLLDVLREAKGDWQMELLFSLGIFTGMRLGDCTTLMWVDVDLAENRISKIAQKTARTSKKRIVIPLHEALRDLLKAAPRDVHSDYVLPGLAELYAKNRGSSLVRRIQPVFEAAGIKTQEQPKSKRRKRVTTRVGFHSLRHSFVSICAKRGVPMAVVQDLVGHGNPAMTRHYTHIDEAAAIAAINVLPALSSDRPQHLSESERLRQIRKLLQNGQELSPREDQILIVLNQ